MEGGGVAGKLKGFFYLFLNQLSTMWEIITGDKTGGGREKEREEEGKYCSSVPNKYETWGGAVELYVL